MDGERIARNAEGEVYYVPANMNYQAWKAAFVDGGAKDGLTPVFVDAILKFTEAEQWALNEYISSGSYKINAPLRNGDPLTKEQRAMADALDSALKKMPVYEGTVYRSLNGEMMDTKSFWDKHIPGNIVRYPAYTSSGTVVYDETMDIQMIIQSKNARDIRKFNPGEFEILFPRNSEFIVVRREGNTVWLEEI